MSWKGILVIFGVLLCWCATTCFIEAYNMYQYYQTFETDVFMQLSIGILVLLIGLLMIIPITKKFITHNRLLKCGDCIIGTIVAINTSNFRVNGVYQKILVVEAHDPELGRSCIYKSQYVNSVKYTVGDELNVYVDKNDRNKYYVDTKNIKSTYNVEYM